MLLFIGISIVFVFSSCEYIFWKFSECIRFALTPLFNHDDPTQPGPNILFLEVLPEFASKLLKPDKKAMFVLSES